MFNRLWSWLVEQIVQPDPWEPQIKPGQFMLRERLARAQVVPGRLLGVVESATEAVDFVVANRLELFFLTVNDGGHYATATETDVWRLMLPPGNWIKISYHFQEPALSPAEVEQLLRRQAA